jgi:hypothetical protein
MDFHLMLPSGEGRSGAELKSFDGAYVFGNLLHRDPYVSAFNAPEGCK